MEQRVMMIGESNPKNGDRVNEEDAPPHVQTPGGSPANAAAAASPASSSSSPAHEFSFSLSLNQSSSSSAKAPDRTGHPLAVDLTPADEIFFHGQLLPLHHRHHRRSSHIPSETSVHPVKDSSGDQDLPPRSQTDHRRKSTGDRRREEKQKPKSFASMIWPPKWRKGSEVKEKEKQGKKVKFDMTQMVKRYMRMVSPLLGFGGTKGKGEDDRQSTYSYSGYINPSKGRKVKKDGNMIRGRSSAPASLRASPANSGVLLPSATSAGAVSSSSESTMEELQSAIQAAIAHCKKSSATSD